MQIAGLKGQSAIEFLSTYAFMLLIISVVILLLFMYFSLPKTILPSVCDFYSGFNCADAIYANTSTGSELLIVATDMVPGIINTSSFSTYLGYVNSTSGYCAPGFAIAGQELYCVAQFSSKAVLGRSYSGTFHIKANYCGAGSSSIDNASCPAGDNFTYAGYLTVSASAFLRGANGAYYSPNGTYYTPITITNLQHGAVPAHFQQMVQFTPSNPSYVTHEMPNLGNIRFYYGDKELYSWCEANCTSTSIGNAIFWVKLPVAIPPLGNRIIDMYIMPYSVNYDDKYAGEAPQLSPIYGEYDNGASVFNFYDNFAGTTLSSSWTQEGTGASFKINNGLTITWNTADGLIYYNKGITSPTIVDMLSTSAYSTTYPGMIVGQATTTTAGWGGGWLENAYSFDYYGGNWRVESIIPTARNVVVQTAAEVTQSIYGIGWGATGAETAYINDNQILSATDTTVAIASTVYPWIGIDDTASGSFNIKWFRTRAYPPNGVMPSTSFGSLYIV